MTTDTRRTILRANALYLTIAAVGGLLFMDLPAILFGHGPAGHVIAATPYAAIGFVESHGLALILGVVLWNAAPVRAWHLPALAVNLLLGTANLVFWQIFVAGDVLPIGYLTTSLHMGFAVAQMVGASMVSESRVYAHYVEASSR